MPFTLSHAAAALPFRKLQPVWPALVIGTFAPDLQYFIWISDEDRSGHHFPGVVLVAIPLALSLLWLFEWCVKGAAIELLPSPLRLRLQDKVQPLSFWGWRRFASIVLWIAVGIATHVLWDQLTHGHTWITAHWGLSWRKVPVPFHAPILINQVLQHVSTVLGLVAVAVWFAAWYRRTTPVQCASLHPMSPVRKVTIVFTMGLIALVAGYPIAILSLGDRTFPISRQLLIATIFEAVTLVFCTQLLFYGLARRISAPVRTVPATQLDGPGR